MPFAILGQGTAVPDLFVPQELCLRAARAFSRAVGEPDAWLTALYERSGLQGRRIVSNPMAAAACNGKAPEELVREAVAPGVESNGWGPTTAERMVQFEKEAGPLAASASRQALDESGLRAAEITHLITVSCTGFRAPGLDFELMHRLGLPPTTERTHIGFMGCHGALNGLRVAQAFASLNPKTRILLCATELCSLHFQYRGGKDQMVANALFADGSAAVVGTGAAYVPPNAWRVAAAGSCLLPNSSDAMTWTIKDHGFEMTLSVEVPSLIARHLAPWMKSWLDKHGLAIDDVCSWAIHPGGPKIVEAAAEALGLSDDLLTVSQEVFADYGNLSSPTLLFILDRLRKRQAPLPCVALGFGPGLVAEAVLFR